MKNVALPLIMMTLSLAACSGESSMQPAQLSSAARTAALNYQTTGSDMSSVIDQYRTDAATVQDIGSCQAVEAQYAGQLAAILDRMNGASATMDQYMSSTAGTANADMACVAAAMSAEFERHVAAACAMADIPGARAEAARHAATMSSWADHQRVRYEQAGTALGMMPPTSETTWTCSHHADGSFAMGGQTWSPGQNPPPMAANPTTSPPTTTTTPWPMPCGSTACPCDGSGHTGAPDAGPAGGSTTDPVVLGKRIFQSGVGVSGQPIARTGGYTGMMMTGCASCHGFDGHGRRTMMFTSPSITYANLTDPAGMLEPDGTRGPVYADDLIRRAVAQGVDPDGQALSTVMPRWQLSDDDWSALLAFLKTLH